MALPYFFDINEIDSGLPHDKIANCAFISGTNLHSKRIVAQRDLFVFNHAQ
jgi:hypothetical protein